MDNRRMRELESLCVQEDHPFCQAVCPVAMDCRGLCSDLAEGLVDRARIKVEEGLPLPLLLSLICDEPCAAGCVLGKCGDSISMAALERFALKEGAPPRKKPSFLAPRPRKVLLIGRGMAAMAALESLRARRYAPEICVTGQSFGGSLEEDSRIPGPLLRETVSRLLEGLEVHMDAPDPESLRGWDCVVIADPSPFGYPGPLDDLTYSTNLQGVFSLPMPSRSPAEEARRGRELVLSMERHLQGASQSAGRSGRGQTRLPMPKEADKPSFAVISKNARATPEEARSEASRCLQCECLVCRPQCLYLQEYDGSPRRYIRTFHNNLIINKGNRTANRMIDSCTLCGLCKEVCPAGLDVGQASLESRRKMVETGHMPPSHHDFPLRDMASALEDTAFMVRPSPSPVKWLFFPGCQLGASEPRWVTDSYSYLTDRLGSVALWVTCCGAPARWGGREALFSSLMDRWAKEWEDLGRPTVITACSTCHSLIRERVQNGAVVTLWEIMDRFGLPVEGKLSPLSVTVSDPCTARHHRASQDAIRRILEKRGVSQEEHPLSRETTECCGFGGLVYSANPGLAARSARRRTGGARHPLAVSCALCQELYGRTGHPVWHVLDLIFAGAGTAPAPRAFLRWSDRRENRRKLMNLMTHNPPEGELPLRIDQNLRETLDQRWITDREILAVIEEAEAGGPKFKRKDREVCLAYSVLGERTLWVMYSKDGGLWAVHDAYSHRMVLGEVMP